MLNSVHQEHLQAMDSFEMFHALQANNEGARMMSAKNFGHAAEKFSVAFHWVQILIDRRCNTSIPKCAMDKFQSCHSEASIHSGQPHIIDFWTRNLQAPLRSHSTSSTGVEVACDGQDKAQQQLNILEFLTDERQWRNARPKHETDGHKFIFHDPIQFPIDTVMKTERSKRLCFKIAIVVAYNLALAFHLAAWTHGDRNCLYRAKEIYEFAFKLHLEQNYDVTLLYSMALMNNLGTIYEILEEYEQAAKCFHHMLGTMMFLLESNESKKIQQWDGFVQNISPLILRDIAAPVA